nr:SDR family NAD(P)-dependent oxidoreductase [Pseudofrankia sp. DC12]
MTGSSRGIGRAIARRLGADGADVVVNYRTNRREALEVVAEIVATGQRAMAVAADVASLDQLRGLFDAADRHYGGADIIVSNVELARFAPIADTSDADYDLTFATNTPRSTFFARRLAASKSAADQSMSPAVPWRSSTARPSRGHRPARVHCWNRRCAVGGETPKFGGRCRHEQPDVNT